MERNWEPLPPSYSCYSGLKEDSLLSPPLIFFNTKMEEAIQKLAHSFCTSEMVLKEQDSLIGNSRATGNSLAVKKYIMHPLQDPGKIIKISALSAYFMGFFSVLPS